MHLQATAHIDWITRHRLCKENIILKKSTFLPILYNFKGPSDEPLSSPSLPELVSHALMTQYQIISTFTQCFNTSQEARSKGVSYNAAVTLLEQGENICNTWLPPLPSLLASLTHGDLCKWRAGRPCLKLQLHPYSSRRHFFCILDFFFFALFYFASTLLDVVLIITWPPSSPDWTPAPIKSKGSVFMKASKSVSQKKTPYQRVRIWYKEENIQKHGRNATPLVKGFCCWYKSEINNSFLYRLSTPESKEVKQFESPTKAGENIIYFLPSVHFKPIGFSRVERPPRLLAENNLECSIQN